jgi:hypothetical protein
MCIIFLLHFLVYTFLSSSPLTFPLILPVLLPRASHYLHLEIIDNSQVVVYDPNIGTASKGVVLGADEHDIEKGTDNRIPTAATTPTNNRNSNKHASYRLSFSAIYDTQKKEKIVFERQSANQQQECCVIS